MSNLSKLSAYFSGKSNDLIDFSPELVKALSKTRSSFEKQGEFMDIEGVSVQEKTEEMGSWRIHRYSGRFIYGFQKGGIFHVIPGDLSSEQPRQANETGEFVFYLNKESGKIEAIYESLAGNTWGQKPKLKSGGGTLTYLFIILLIVVASFIAAYLWVQVDPNLQRVGQPLSELGGSQ